MINGRGTISLSETVRLVGGLFGVGADCGFSTKKFGGGGRTLLFLARVSSGKCKLYYGYSMVRNVIITLKLPFASLTRAPFYL